MSSRGDQYDSQSGSGQTAEFAAQVEKEIKDYEQLQKTQAKELRILSLQDLRVAPIRYRISARMTIEGFAQLVHLPERVPGVSSVRTNTVL